MKKSKLLPIKIIFGAVAALTPLTTLVACGEQKVDPQPERKPTEQQLKIFKIDNGVLKGFRGDVDQDLLRDYCKNNTLVLPPCKVIAAHAFDKTYSLNTEPRPTWTKIEISSDTTEIEEFAFYWNEATQITWEGGVSASQLTTIGDDTFAGCTKLESFAFPSGVTSIGVHAFLNCKSLKLLDFTCFNTDALLEKLKTLTQTGMADHVFESGYGSEEGQTDGKIKFHEPDTNLHRTDHNNMILGAIRSNLWAAGLGTLISGSPTAYPKQWDFDASANAYDPKFADFNGAVVHYNPVPYRWLDVTNTGTLIGFDSLHHQRIALDDEKQYCNTLLITDNIKEISSSFNFLSRHEKTTTDAKWSYLWFDDDSKVEIIPDRFAEWNPFISEIRLNHTIREIGINAFSDLSNLCRINLSDDCDDEEHQTNIVKFDANCLNSSGIDDSTKAEHKDLYLYSRDVEEIKRADTSIKFNPHLLKLHDGLEYMGHMALYHLTGVEVVSLGTINESIVKPFEDGGGALSFVDMEWEKHGKDRQSTYFHILDLSRLTYAIAEDESISGTLATWVNKIPAVDEQKDPKLINSIFTGVIKPDATHHYTFTPTVVMPKPVGGEGEVTSTQFIGLKDGETKETGWHNHKTTPFYWFVMHSGISHGGFEWDLKNEFPI